MTLIHQDISEKVIGAAMEVHRNLGHGFLEAVYQEAMEVELVAKEIAFSSQPALTIRYKGKPLQHTYKADLIVSDRVLVELKAVSALTEIDQAQVLHYLKATGLQLGLLINFGKPSLEWKRLISKGYFEVTNRDNP